MSRNLLQDARRLKNQKIQRQIDLEDKVTQREAQKVAAAEKIIRSCLPSMEVLLDLVRTYFNMSEDLSGTNLIDEIILKSFGVGYWQDDVGDLKFALMQKQETVDHGGEMYFPLYVYGLKFFNIYGHDIYVVPTKTKKVVCILLNMSSGEKQIFRDDITYERAVEIVSNFV